MRFILQHGKPFILLLLFLPVMTVASIYLYQKYMQTTEEIHQIIYADLISNKERLFHNYTNYIFGRLGDDFVQELHKNPQLREHFEADLALIMTDEVKYLYVLHFDPEDNRLRYLLDSSQDEEERGEFNQKFDPQTDIWKVARATKTAQIRRQELDSIWISYALPIIINNEVVAILGADFSNDGQAHITEAVNPMKRLYFYIALFMLIMLLSAYWQFIIYYRNRRRSLIDPLTRIYNRQYLFDLLTTINIDDYQILMIDLDHFKQVNDLYGHDIGDIVLQSVSAKVLSLIRKEDILIRYGGEEFILLLHKQNARQCREIGNRIKTSMKEQPIKAKEHTLRITLSIGINPYPGHAKDIDEAIKIADEQLYKAKSGGRDRVEILDEKNRRQSHSSKRIDDVKSAMLEDRIRCMYQPIYDMSGKPKKYEVLVRMVERDGSIITPDNFLPAIAHTNIYSKLTERVLQIALKQLREEPIELSINLGLQDIFNDDIIEIITTLLLANKELASRLTFEILETEEIQNFDLIKKRLAAIKALNVKIALDDFGSGYANFRYLVHLGIDILKIDGSLIRDIDSNQNAYHIVRTINDFAGKMNITTIAEQVETRMELKTIRRIGIDYIQGFYLAKPSFDLSKEKRSMR